MFSDSVCFLHKISFAFQCWLSLHLLFLHPNNMSLTNHFLVGKIAHHHLIK
jgi:hypothetical protein